eukprot:10506138-Heterocapsa_arctica.AAC.1
MQALSTQAANRLRSHARGHALVCTSMRPTLGCVGSTSASARCSVSVRAAQYTHAHTPTAHIQRTDAHSCARRARPP